MALFCRLIGFRNRFAGFLRLTGEFTTVPVENGYEFSAVLEYLQRVRILRGDETLDIFEGFRDGFGVFAVVHGSLLVDAIEMDSSFNVYLFPTIAREKVEECARQSGLSVLQTIRQLEPDRALRIVGEADRS